MATWKEIALRTTWPTSMNELDITATPYESAVFLGLGLQNSISSTVGVENSFEYSFRYGKVNCYSPSRMWSSSIGGVTYHNLVIFC